MTGGHIFTVVVAGTAQAGKTALLSKHLRDIVDDAYVATSGLVVHAANSDTSLGPTKVQFIDTPSSWLQGKALVNACKGAGALIVVADATSPERFSQLAALSDAKAALAPGAFVALALNKQDLAHNVQESDITKLVKLLGAQLYHTSAKSGDGVFALFAAAVSAIASGVRSGTLRQSIVTPRKVAVYGQINDARFQRAVAAVKALADDYPQVNADVKGLVPAEWDAFLPAIQKALGGSAHMHTFSPLVVVDGKYCGSEDELLQLLRRKYGYYEPNLPGQHFQTLAESAYKQWMTETKHEFAFFDISIGDKSSGRIVFELYSDLVPNAVANFIACSRNAYRGSPIHRVVPGGWIQGGDIQDGSGDNSQASTGGLLADECFGVTHSAAGVLGLANRGPHTNGSQWYITLAPAPWMNERFQAIGRVIEGMRVVNAIAKQPLFNERPKDVRITDCEVNAM